MSGIIEVGNLSFGYTSRSKILKDVSFVVPPGTFLAIAGPNGAGKSTLLNLMSGTLKSRSGKITIDSRRIGSYGAQALAAKVAVVRQESAPIFGFSVIETVMMARTPYFGAAGFESQADRDIVEESLEMTDTAAFASRPLMSLSSGERQRVFIARALAQNSPILLLDEPTSFLDLKHQVGIYDLLKAAQLEKGKTIVAVTHDINLACQYCDDALLLGTDNFYRHGPSNDVLSEEQIRKVFGVQILTGTIGQARFFMPLGERARVHKETDTRPPDESET